MSATARDTSNRYEKVDGNVLRMKPLGRRPKGRILTELGWAVIVGVVVLLSLGALVVDRLLK